MSESYSVSCKKKHSIDIKIVGQELKFTRDFEGEGWNSCADHSKALKNMSLGKNCMKCGRLIAEAF